jgi:hypothetical protein
VSAYYLIKSSAKIELIVFEFMKVMSDKRSAFGRPSDMLLGFNVRRNRRMKSASIFPVLILALPALGQKPLPALKDGTVIDEKAEFRQDGPLRIAGRVKLKGMTLDLRGPISLAAGAEFELEDVKVKVSDPPDSPNGTSALHCEGPAKVKIHRSSMTAVGAAHPIWMLQGDLQVEDFQTANSEFHLDHVQAKLRNLTIFELDVSESSQVVGQHLRLVFLSTHTGNHEKISFTDIPADRPFSRKLRMGSLAAADLTDTVARFFLLYVRGQSDVSLSRIGRAQLAIAPACRGTLRLPRGSVGSMDKPLVIPEPGTSDCLFSLHLQHVDVDTWDVYAGDGAQLTFTDSVIDELTATGQARLTVNNSEVYADWLSLSGDAQLVVQHSTVGALRLAEYRSDLATSQVRLSGHSSATFDRVQFDCGVTAAEDSTIVIRDSETPPKYIRRSGRATVETDPSLPVEDLGKGT